MRDDLGESYTGGLAKKALGVIAIIASLYHLYLVFHPYTPLSYLYRIGILDLTQLQRATHVFFILLVGFLLSFITRPRMGRVRLAIAYIASILTLIPTIQLALYLKSPLYSTLILLIWFVSILSPLVLRSSEKARYLDLVCLAAAVPPYLYMVYDYENLIYRAISPLPADLYMGWSEVLLLMGLVLRLVGPEMPLLVTIFILYNIYAPGLPPPWSHPGFSIDYLVGKIYIESEAALFGLVTGVSLKYVVYFTILAGILGALGYGEAMARTFLSRMGRSPASVGRVAPLMGAGMGMISGSGAADTTFISSTMKPIFKAAGYDDLSAAGLAANAGTLAIITPPILGSVAFIMAEILAIPYSSVVIMAIIPALLYISSIYLYNEYYSRKAGLKPVVVSEKGSFKIHVFAPAFLILALIFLGYSIPLAVTIAIVFSIILAALDKDLRPRIRNIWVGLQEGFIPMASIGASIAMANVIMSMVVISGLSQKFTLALLAVIQNSLVLAILFAWGFSLLLGMGVPPTATYVLSSLLTAPAIIGLATSLGIPQDTATLSTHMFLFYMAMLADITPPVALSAFAAAAVFRLDPIKTGVKAALVAIPKHIYSISFVYSYWGASILILPVLLHSPPQEAAILTITRVAAILAGIWFLTLANVGYHRGEIVKPLRIVLAIAGIMMIIPSEILNIAALPIGLGSIIASTRIKKTAPQIEK